MKSIPAFLVIAFMLFAKQPAAAQNATDTLKLMPRHTYLITKTNGAQIKANILNESDRDVMVNAPEIGIILIHKADISSILELEQKYRQTTKESHGRLAYFEIGAGGGTSFCFRTGFTVIFKDDNLLSAGFHFSSKIDPLKPADYPQAFFPTYPQVTFNALYINYGKVFILPGTHARWALKGGIIAGICSMPTDYEYKPFIEANWSTSTVVYKYVYSRMSVAAGGIFFQPEIQLPITPRFGINIGCYLDMNTATTPSVGINATLMFGKVMERKIKGKSSIK